MHSELLKLGPITIQSYGFMIAIGFLAAILLATYRGKRLDYNTDIISNLAILCLVGGFFGAKLLFIITEIKNIILEPSILLNLSTGFVVYGGIIGGVLVGYLYSRIKKFSFMEYFDLMIPSIAIAQGFGRIGCFLAGCCYGRETNSFLGVVFKDSLIAPNGVSLLPTQLFSSAGDFIIATILLSYAKRKREKGKVVGLYLILYSVGRFAVEYLRNDPRGAVGIFSTSQLISIGTVALGAFLFTFAKPYIAKINKA